MALTDIKAGVQEAENKLIPQLDELLRDRKIVISLWGKPILTITFEKK